MLILAFDASTPVITAAVAQERDVLAEVSVTVRGTSEILLPAVHQALSLSGKTMQEVELILTGVGPGTFTGIRIAVSTARALSLGTGIPLSANSTLAALAAPAPTDDVLAVLDARRGEIFAQRFSGRLPSGSIKCLRPEDLTSDGSPMILGDGAIRYREALSALGTLPPDDSPLHRVSAVGHVLSADFSIIAAEELTPIYIRDPDAKVRRKLNPWSKP